MRAAHVVGVRHAQATEQRLLLDPNSVQESRKAEPHDEHHARPVEIAEAYAEQRRHSCYTVEVHVRSLKELHVGDPVRVTFQLLDFDLKRLHYFEQLFHAVEGWLSATSENMALHVDRGEQRTAIFPDGIRARLKRMQAVHAHLPRPEGIGRRIAM